MGLITVEGNGKNKYSLVEDLIIVKLANERKTIQQIGWYLHKCGFDRSENSLQYRTGKRVLRHAGVTFEKLHGVTTDQVNEARQKAEELLSKVKK